MNDVFANFQENLVSAVEQTAFWREQMAGAYPDDTRNTRSALALTKLAASLREIPSDHPMLRRAWGLWFGLRGSDDYTPAKDAEPFIDVESALLKRYGFTSAASGDAEEFLHEYVCAIDAEKARQDRGD